MSKEKNSDETPNKADLSSSNSLSTQNSTESPANTQMLNLIELASKKNDVDQADIDNFRVVSRYLSISEIRFARPNISASFLDNLVKKTAESEKNQTTDNSKNNQPENNKNNELLSKEEIDNYMANFLKERNDLTKNLEERNNQLNLDKNDKQIEEIKK
jgi:hypothetical protein